MVEVWGRVCARVAGCLVCAMEVGGEGGGRDRGCVGEGGHMGKLCVLE